MASAVAGFVALLVASIGALVVFNMFVVRRAEALVPRVGKTIVVDGVEVHYVDVGAGPVVLMLHGLASQLQVYTYSLTPLLQDRYRLIVIDRPGAGYSQALASASLGAQADLFSRFLRALAIDRALVVGHSLGGALALALALDHPDQVAGLALLAPATQPQSTVPHTLRGLAIGSDLARWLIGWTVAPAIGLFARRAGLAAVFAPDPVPGDFATRAGGVLAMRPANFRNASRDLVDVGRGLAAYATRYPAIARPVGVLFGTSDRTLDYRLHGEVLQHQIAGAALELIQDGGHMTPVSAPERSAAFIDEMAVRAGLVSSPAARDAAPALPLP